MAKTWLIFLSLLVVVTMYFTVVNGYGRMVGGRTPISDVKTNKEVQGLGRFSVEEYNKRSGSSGCGGRRELVFSEVVEAERQVVSGIKYYLEIEASQNGLTRTFESVVVVKPWLHSKELLIFSPSSQ